MKIALIAIAFAGLLATPAMAQSYGGSNPSDNTSNGQQQQSTDPTQRLGTQDQMQRPNAACPPGSTNPECEQAQVPYSNPSGQNNGGSSGNMGGQSDQGGGSSDQGDTSGR